MKKVNVVNDFCGRDVAEWLVGLNYSAIVEAISAGQIVKLKLMHEIDVELSYVQEHNEKWQKLLLVNVATGHRDCEYISFETLQTIIPHLLMRQLRGFKTASVIERLFFLATDTSNKDTRVISGIVDNYKVMLSRTREELYYHDVTRFIDKISVEATDDCPEELKYELIPSNLMCTHNWCGINNIDTVDFSWQHLSIHVEHRILTLLINAVREKREQYRLTAENMVASLEEKLRKGLTEDYEEDECTSIVLTKEGESYRYGEALITIDAGWETNVIDRVAYEDTLLSINVEYDDEDEEANVHYFVPYSGSMVEAIMTELVINS